jgi:hypothetical protein
VAHVRQLHLRVCQHSHLPFRALVLAPSSHNERIIDSRANKLLDTGALELAGLLDVPGQMRLYVVTRWLQRSGNDYLKHANLTVTYLRASWGESSRNAEHDDCFGANMLRKVDFVAGIRSIQGHGRNRISNLYSQCTLGGMWTLRIAGFYSYPAAALNSVQFSRADKTQSRQNLHRHNESCKLHRAL